MDSFSSRLAEAVCRAHNPVVVGLDPRLEHLPPAIKPSSSDVEAIAEAYRAFCNGIVDVVAPLVPAVKPQMAFFEQLGPKGLAALADVVQYARQKKMLVILDGKRNDIGSTAEAYAQAYLSGPDSAWQADALTVNPYLGDDSLQPFVDVAAESGTGVFVLVKTSNPGSGVYQDLVADACTLYEHVANDVQRMAEETIDQTGYGIIGAVVGATYPEELAEMRSVMEHAWILVPGYGSQGGTAQDVAPAFDEHGLGAIVNSSRGIIFAHESPEYCDRYGEMRWQAAVEAATCAMIEELRYATPAGEL